MLICQPIIIIIYATTAHDHIKRHTRWTRNLTVALTISFSSSPLPTNMRIPNTAEFLALFVSTGQLTDFSDQRKTDIILFMISTRLTRVGFHSISVHWLRGTGQSTLQPTSLYSQTRWYLQFYCQTFERPHVSIFIGHICTFYLSIEIQVPDHMRKRQDQWPVHQSQYWPGEIYSPTYTSHILTKTIVVENLPWTPGTRLQTNSSSCMAGKCPVHC